MKLSTDRIFYVYEWYDVDNNLPFYVGKGKLNRMFEVKRRHADFIKYYNNHSCNVRKVKDNLTEEEAFIYESNLIKKYEKLGIVLANKTSKITGGITHTKEELVKISNASKDMWKNPEYRKLFKKKVDEYWSIPENRAKCRARAKEVNNRPEVIEKQRLSHLGQVPYNKGKKMDESYCRKMKEVLNRPDTIKKMSLSNNSNKRLTVKNSITGDIYRYYNIQEFIDKQKFIDNKYKNKRNLWRYIKSHNYSYNEYRFEVEDYG